ncbi:MAG: hypothetical protein E6K64_08480 [Nitrospirae bacterium]|nr:MAG: hypothetical protein E6K64_08480 [Nitrospirota bacterium]
MKKEYVIFAMVVLLVWVSRNNIPPRFQFWKTTDTMITVLNISCKDLSDVTLVVWSEPHLLGTIRKDRVKNFKTPRLSDTTDVIIKFKYGSEPVERHVGALNEASDYKMNIQVNFAGVVTAQVGTVSSGDSDN